MRAHYTNHRRWKKPLFLLVLVLLASVVSAAALFRPTAGRGHRVAGQKRAVGPKGNVKNSFLGGPSSQEENGVDEAGVPVEASEEGPSTPSDVLAENKGLSLDKKGHSLLSEGPSKENIIDPHAKQDVKEQVNGQEDTPTVDNSSSEDNSQSADDSDTSEDDYHTTTDDSDFDSEEDSESVSVDNKSQEESDDEFVSMDMSEEHKQRIIDDINQSQRYGSMLMFEGLDGKVFVPNPIDSNDEDVSYKVAVPSRDVRKKLHEHVTPKAKYNDWQDMESQPVSEFKEDEERTAANVSYINPIKANANMAAQVTGYPNDQKATVEDDPEDEEELKNGPPSGDSVPEVDGEDEPREVRIEDIPKLNPDGSTGSSPTPSIVGGADKSEVSQPVTAPTSTTATITLAGPSPATVTLKLPVGSVPIESTYRNPENFDNNPPSVKNQPMTSPATTPTTSTPTSTPVVNTTKNTPIADTTSTPAPVVNVQIITTTSEAPTDPKAPINPPISTPPKDDANNAFFEKSVEYEDSVLAANNIRTLGGGFSPRRKASPPSSTGATMELTQKSSYTEPTPLPPPPALNPNIPNMEEDEGKEAADLSSSSAPISKSNPNLENELSTMSKLSIGLLSFLCLVLAFGMAVLGFNVSKTYRANTAHPPPMNFVDTRLEQTTLEADPSFA